MNKIKLIGLILLLILMTGCNKTENIKTIDEVEKPVVLETLKDPDEIMKSFYSILNHYEPEEISFFIEANIDQLDVSKADLMILDYEELLQRNLNTLLLEYEMANKKPELMNAYNLGITENIETIKDEQLRKLVTHTIDAGYILLKSEGYIYPEIDYKKILDHEEFISAEVKSYIEIMEIETKNRFTYGDMIEIPLEELLYRALTAEKYLIANRGARTSNKIYSLYLDYIDGTIVGNGNPYVMTIDGSSIIKDEILNGYREFITKNRDSKTSIFIKEYIDILENHNKDIDSPEVIVFYNNRHDNLKELFRDLGL